MSLWSPVVVSTYPCGLASSQAHGSGSSWPTASLPARTVVCAGRWSHVWSAISDYQLDFRFVLSASVFPRSCMFFVKEAFEADGINPFRYHDDASDYDDESRVPDDIR
jgi:hypothetical protein